MLHLSHYYACYYALIFLLYQQQQQAASSLTVIIDGATTSEWATRDQYKRIVEQQQQHHNHQLLHQPSAGDYQPTTSQNHHRLSSSPFLELPEAPPRLQEQREQLQDDNGNRQRPLEDAYQQPEVAEGLLLEQQPANSPIWLLNQASARSLEDLANIGDRPVDDNPNELLVGEPVPQHTSRIRGRESQLRKYCGYQLMDVLELVCQGRYYGGQPEVVEPTIKSRRSSHSRALGQQQRSDSHTDNAGSLQEAKEGDNLVIEKSLSNRNRHSRKVLYRRIREEALWRGVTKECCDNPCRMEDLKNYCQPT